MVSRNSKVHDSAGSLFFLTTSDRLSKSQNPKEFCVSHFLRQVTGCAYTICSYGQILTSCTISSGSFFPPGPVSSYTLFGLICCIRLLCDWLFRLYHHIIYICYFVASCLFLLWYTLFLQRCFVLLSKEIRFLSSCFPFLAMSTFSWERIRLFAAWGVQGVAFLPIFVFCLFILSFIFFVLLLIVLFVLFPVAVISLLPRIIIIIPCELFPPAFAGQEKAFTGVWETASFFRFLGPFSVFKLI